MNGWDWVWMTASMMVVGTALVVLLVMMLFRGSQEGWPAHKSDTALDILEQRFAKGEIDEKEYQHRRGLLQH